MALLSDKELKAKYKPTFWKDPDKFYATEVLKKEGFTRKYCPTCKKPFWTLTDREICGDPGCSPDESFSFIGKTPAKNQLSYIDVWKKFSKMFEGFGYTPIKRYPVVARWNPTMEYTNASIAAFQPFVISGEVAPPANPLVIPQFCLRFVDIDNVGITMSHHTGFIMIGQHMFVKPEDWDQNKVFSHLHQWFNKGLGLPNKEITFHEDAWAGGGNLGCCMELFSRGCELGNQVYMLYEQTSKGVQELNQKVLDMGMGMERNAWFSQGVPTIYDAVFPTVVKKLCGETGFKPDQKLLKKYVPFAGKLNIDEVEDITKAWQDVANDVGVEVKELKNMIMPLSAIYSIGEHTRALLFTLNDGGLPSNVGGGYNLRLMIRRMLAFIEENKWNVYLPEVCNWHAEYLKPIFPELSEKLDNIQKILDVEIAKFKSTRQKTLQIVERLAEKKVSQEKLLELYDSQGISPELLREAAKSKGKEIKVPENFYGLIAERHEKREGVGTTAVDKVNLEGVEETKAGYYDNWKEVEFDGNVIKVDGKNVVLDSTLFYPTSGGQEHDLGELNGLNVVDVIKQGPHIIHVIEGKLNEGDKVHGKIDFARRLQLAQHHTSTHIVNAAAKKILGPHINQAGAKKTLEKAHIDLTHYQSISDEEMMKIEEEANKIIKKTIPIEKKFYPRDEAEKKFGVEIYQGGAVPGKSIRIVNIKGVDVEACGGTHLDNTSEAEEIKILKTTKIQDGVVRVTFVAGERAKQEDAKEGDILQETADLLEVKPDQVPARCKELFSVWKKVGKLKKKGQEITPEMKQLSSKEKFDGDCLVKAAEVLKTQPEHVPKTVARFLKDLK